jgi:hypothetical protein
MTTFNENRKLVKEMDNTKKRNDSPPLFARKAFLLNL